MNKTLEETKLSTQGQPEFRVCPACGTSNNLNTLGKQEYRCEQCNLELAYLDFTPNGVIRTILGWLRTEGELIEGRYRVKSVLGKGGFGTTYLVEDLRLNGKPRALKEVPDLLFDEYETKLLSRLSHPSIPDIIDRSIVGNMVYLVLEFGGNRTLAGERKRNQGRIRQAMLLPWMRQLCEVLIYLHSQTPPIIHRDLKPDNILLDETGRIMLIDFGIAKESDPTEMTRTLGRAASYGFSPPEQAMGTGTDERSEIYALAATYYVLLTGEKPPAAHERVAGKEIVPPSQIVPEISPRLEAAILKALNLNVNHRQQTVKEFSLALEAVDSGVEIPTRAADYAERTTLLSNAIGATGVHPASIQLPVAGVSPVKSATLSEAARSRQTSNRNVMMLVAGIAIVLAATLAAGYLFWPEKAFVTVKAVEDRTTTDTITAKEPAGRGTKNERVTIENTTPGQVMTEKPVAKRQSDDQRNPFENAPGSKVDLNSDQTSDRAISKFPVIERPTKRPVLAKSPIPLPVKTKPNKISKINIPPPTDMIETPLER